VTAPVLPSILARVSGALVAWALLWGLVLGLAGWLAVRHELDELLDDTLQAAAEELLAPLSAGLVPPPMPAAPGVTASGRFAWQLVLHDGADARVLSASSAAPQRPLQATASAGFADVPGWRVFGAALSEPGRYLYVAQSRGERDETAEEVALALLLATVPMALLAVLWLRSRLRHELQPLQALSDALGRFDLLAPGATLGPAARRELQPVHEAVDRLSRRLARRLAQERAFAAHAAHALRTPLAGIDAQLAVALREAPQALQPRLLRVRSAGVRLQRVVAALLALFRSGVDPRREAVYLPALLARLPVDGLQVSVQADEPVLADADLLSAALLNLLDNAVRHGARHLHLSLPRPGLLCLSDDGPGVAAERLPLLRQSLQRADDEGDGSSRAGVGLGLKLVDLVARAHGGCLVLPEPEPGAGFTVHLWLEPPPAEIAP
jgi:signal transduction histidine kinase